MSPFRALRTPRSEELTRVPPDICSALREKPEDVLNVHVHQGHSLARESLAAVALHDLYAPADRRRVTGNLMVRRSARSAMESQAWQRRFVITRYRGNPLNGSCQGHRCETVRTARRARRLMTFR